MSHYKQDQVPVTYPPPPQSYHPTAAEQGPYVVPPPAGYPMQGGADYPQQPAHRVETKSRGDGFWKGCCAALCCCCVLDACF